MEKEIWKPVKEYEDFYEISNHGRLKRLARTWNSGIYGNAKISRKETITLGSLTSEGYYVFDLCKNGKSKKTKIHRIVAQHFLPNPDNHNVVNHKDGNKSNNHISNLEWCSQKFNNEHAYITKLRKPKLTNEEVLNIRSLYETGNYAMKRLAEMHGVKYRTVWCIIHRKTWKHI